MEHTWDYWRRRVDGHPEVSFRAGVIVWNAGKMLLIRGNDIKRRRRTLSGRWGPPKGCVDPSEQYVWETAARELREETGIVIRKDILLAAEMCLYVRHDGPAIKSIYLFYVVTLPRRPKVRIDRAEISDHGWFDREHLPPNTTIVMKYYCG